LLDPPPASRHSLDKLGVTDYRGQPCLDKVIWPSVGSL
jgi:hypothetical protein